MKEIGGYFGLEQLVSNEYYNDLVALNSGRNALLYVLKSKNIKKLYIPYYLCKSVSDMCEKNGYPLEFYNIDEYFSPVFNRALGENDYIYVVNYYGQLSQDRILNIKDKYKRIIIDNSQAFFQKPMTGIDTIYSCRKYFGVADGAYLFTDILLDERLEVDISKERMLHVLGRFEGKASDYYKKFKECDASLKFEPLKQMSKLTSNILGAIDYGRVKSIRDVNYAYLESKLKQINKLELTTPEGPFAYPLYFKNGMKNKKILASKGIYIPTLWPNVLEGYSEKSIEYDYAANILPLPCDQRFSEKEMEYMINEILKTMEVIL